MGDWRHCESGPNSRDALVLNMNDIQLFGIAFYAIGVVLLLAFSVKICNAVSHYIDGVFFFSLCMLLSVMMVYKYWDCEFVVNHWFDLT